MNTRDVATVIDNHFSYVDFPDSIVGIVTMLDPHSGSRFERGYVGQQTGLMRVSGDDVFEIYCAAFPSPDVFSRLKEQGVQDALLMVKHPMDWRELGRGFVPLTDQQLMFLDQRRISLYSIHAPLDNCEDVSPSYHFSLEVGDEVRYPIEVDGRNFGYVVDFPNAVSFNDIKERLKKQYGLSKLQEHCDHDLVYTAAIIAGGGDDVGLLERAKRFDCDTYVTGILHFRGSEFAREHNPRFIAALQDSSLNALGVTHYFSELSGLSRLPEHMGQALNLPITFIFENGKAKELKTAWGKIL